MIEYIEGNDLSIFLKPADAGLPGGSGGSPSFKGLAETQVIPWMMQVSSALTYLHSQVPPVIHGDIKPENIKIAPDGRAVLVDLGFTATKWTRRAADPRIRCPRAVWFQRPGSAERRVLLRRLFTPCSLAWFLRAASTWPRARPRRIPARQLNPQISAETDRLIQQYSADKPQRPPAGYECRQRCPDGGLHPPGWRSWHPRRNRGHCSRGWTYPGCSAEPRPPPLPAPGRQRRRRPPVPARLRVVSQRRFRLEI